MLATLYSIMSSTMWSWREAETSLSRAKVIRAIRETFIDPKLFCSVQVLLCRKDCRSLDKQLTLDTRSQMRHAGSAKGRLTVGNAFAKHQTLVSAPG